jgi:hypothetical protein
MKRLSVITVALLTTASLAAITSQRAAGATALDSQSVSLVGQTIFLAGDGCVGENILITSGTLEIRTLDLTTPTGRRVTIFSILYRNVSGVGTTTGTKYQIQDVLVLTSVDWVGGGPFETTVANTGLRVVGPGPDNNRWAIFVMHVTGNSDLGTIAVDFQHADLACR